MPSGSDSKSTSTRSKKNAGIAAEAPAELDNQITDQATTDEQVAKETKPKRAKARSRSRAKPRAVMLPVLVVDETILLPHMSIPFAIEDEEASMVLDRAMRLPSRQVLVLTERRIYPPNGEGAVAEDPGVDGVFRELVADALAEVMAEEEAAGEGNAPSDDAAERPENADEEWHSSAEDIEEEYELCTV
jgi:hypothetical protein